MVVINGNPKILTSNRYETLTRETAVARLSEVSGNITSLQDPKSKKKIPLIMAKCARVDTIFVNGIKVQTSGKSLLSIRPTA